MNQVWIPEGYESCLGLYDTQKAIGLIKNLFQQKLCLALHLKRVTAPLFVTPSSGLNDDLNGVERPVGFDIPAVGGSDGEGAQVVHSLAKWKRMALYRYDFYPGNGLLTDMNAIRRDEELDNLHSVYVGSVGLGKGDPAGAAHARLSAGDGEEDCGRHLQHDGGAAVLLPAAARRTFARHHVCDDAGAGGSLARSCPQGARGRAARGMPHGLHHADRRQAALRPAPRRPRPGL